MVKHISKIAHGSDVYYIKDTEARSALIDKTEKGVANGVATLDSAGKVPTSQLPSYVDDVLEYDTKSAFPTTGEAGKIYVDKSTNTTWRWSGSAYTQIKGDLAIGTTTGTAADGGVANTHYNNKSNPHSVTKAQVGLGSVVNTGDSATPVSGGTTKFTTGGAYTELNKKVDKVSGKGLSTNDYTTDEKDKLSGIASGAQANVIETVKVNGTALTPSSKAVNVTVPTKTSELTNNSNFVSDASYVHTDNNYTATEKSKLSGIASGAEVNQNAFSNVGVKVGNTTTTVAADAKTDTVTLIQGSNVTLTADTTNDTVTIAATNTTYSAATTSAAGLMSADDKTKLNGIATGATKVTTDTVSGWGYTKNAGTITGIKMNGASKGTSGVVDLGTVITAHQDISGKVDKTTTVNGHALSGNVSVTKSDVGLGNVTNDSQVKRSEMGAASGVATLDSNGKVPSSQLPSYVDDVIEGYFYNSKFYKESGHTTEITGETGKIYVDLSTNKTYRWGGSAYAVISETLALGETSSTAYRGDRGKTAYTHSQTTSGNPHNVTKSDVGLGNVGNFKAVSTVASQGLTDTEKSNARTNIGAGTSSFSGSYNDLSNKPTIPAAAANGTYTVKTLVGSTTTSVSDFTANQSSADDVTFVQGSNVTITPDATNRKITIAAKDTTYSSKSAASGGTDVSLVTTGEKYTWNSKTSNTGTVTKVTAGTGLTGGDITTTGTIALATSGVTAGTYKRVTVDAYGRVTSGDNTDSDTKNTAGTTNKTGTKMFLAAATEQSANPVTYSNSNCYIGTDNCLYSGNAKVLTSHQSLSNYYTKTQVDALTRHTRLTDFDLNVLKQAVADQNLEKYGLKVGDQKTINGHTYVIAGLNCMKGSHENTCTTNHVGLIVIPHTTQAWNVSGNTYTGSNGRGAGYLNSDLHYYLKNTVLPMAQADLGSTNLLAHNKHLSNAVNQNGYNRIGEATGCSSGFTWSEEYISALSEMQVYGGTVWSSSGYDTGEANQQLEVFSKYKHTDIFGNEYIWLRDVVTATIAADAYGKGGAYIGTASNEINVAGLILFK